MGVLPSSFAEAKTGLILPPAADFHPLRAQGESLLVWVGFDAVQGDELQAQVAHPVEYAVKGRLIGEWAGDYSPASRHILDLQPLEPVGPLAR